MNIIQLKMVYMLLIIFSCLFTTAKASSVNQQQQTITQLYVGFFGRAPDPSGLAYWESVLSAGADISAIANSFAASKDSMTGPRLTPELIVTNVYKNLFAKAPDPSVLVYWSLKLAQGTFTAAQLVLQIANSAQGVEKQALDNRITVASSITNSLNTTNLILEYIPGTDLYKNLNAALSSVTEDAHSVDSANSAVQTAISGNSAPATPPSNNYTNSQKDLAKAEDAVTTAQENLTKAQAGGNEKAINDAKETLSIVLSAKVEAAQQVYDSAPTDAKAAAQATLDSATAALKQFGVVA